MFERILGRSSLQLRNIKWTEITHPDDLQGDLDRFERFKKGEIQQYSLEKRFIRPDGTIVWTSMTVSPLLGSDKHSLHLCLLEDITARKEMEESLRESERRKSVLLSHLPGMAYRCKYDRNGTMLYISEGCFKLTGYEPECFLNNRDMPFNDIIAAEYRSLLLKEWDRTVPWGIPYRLEYEITTAGGERKWVLEMGEGVYDDKGELDVLEGIILDISDQKRMENDLRYCSEHEVWTGLYNRRSLENILSGDDRAAEKSAVVGVNLSSMHLLSLNYGFHYSQALFKRIADAMRLYCNEHRQLFNT